MSYDVPIKSKEKQRSRELSGSGSDEDKPTTVVADPYFQRDTAANYNSELN